MMRTRTDNAGFTLTEMALVLALIGVFLAAVWGAAVDVYASINAVAIERQILRIGLNGANIFSTQRLAADSQAMNDSCGQTPPCGTRLLLAASVIEPGFVVSGKYDTSMTGLPMYVVRGGFFLWSGIENTSIYAFQHGDCAGPHQPPCSGSTVVEFDVMGIPSSLCMKIVLDMINNKPDNILDVEGLTNGWGPIAGGAYYGNPTLPEKIDAATASDACGGTMSAFDYLTTNNSMVWLFFGPHN